MRRAIIRLLPLVLSACVPQQGRLETNRFQSEDYPYAVFYTADGKPMSPLGPNWRLDNFTEVVPATRGSAGTFDPKKADAYVVTREYDVDDDGKVDLKEREPFYDLLLEHTQKDAAMWVRTVPISGHERDKELRVFAERYVDAVAGAGTITVRFGAEGATGSVERRFASRILGSKACASSKREAYRVDFEVANVDQLQLSEQARWSRGSLVIIRTGYSRQVRAIGRNGDYPVLMLIGLSSSPEDYEALSPDFDQLLERTVLGDPRGGLAMHGETTCTATPTAEPETPAAPVAPAETSGGEQEPDPESLLQPMPPEDEE